MNSPDISRFCKNAEYRLASCIPKCARNSHCTAKPVPNTSALHAAKSGRVTNSGSSARPKRRYVQMIAMSATAHTTLTIP